MAIDKERTSNSASNAEHLSLARTHDMVIRPMLIKPERRPTPHYSALLMSGDRASNRPRVGLYRVDGMIG